MGKCFTPSSDESRVPVRERSSTKDTPPSSVHMADNRPGTLVQRKLRAKANKGPEAGVLAQFKSIITAYNSQTLQRKERPEEEELLQGKFSVFQRHELEEEEELLQAKFKAVQRQELEEEELLQTKFMPTQLKCCGDKNKTITEQEQQTLQRMEIPEEEELLQAKFKARQRKSLEEEALQMKAVPLQKGENNTGLPDTLKSGIEKLSGYAMDDVRVHYNSSQPAQLNAHAYAQGTDIHLAPGQEKHLSHEAWHVVQQKQGRVKPTFQMKGDVHINDDVRLEREADVMGVRALQLHFSLNDTFESPIQKKHSMCVSRSLNQTSQLVSVVVGGATYQVLGTIPGTTFQVVRPNWKLFGARRILDTVSNTLLPLTRLNVIEGIQIRNIFNALNVQGVVGLDSMVRSLENATGLLIPPRVTLARIRLIQNKLTNLVMIRILADHPAIVAMYPPGTLSPIFATAFQSLEIPGSDPHKDGQVVVYINYLTIGGAPLRVVYKP
ncbi:MAG TPA: DUF4157 domain-containing protein, partial [Eudoraea sp.]|nr:DUF4157 domain-containing protein [Eudoraea sp.]